MFTSSLNWSIVLSEEWHLTYFCGTLDINLILPIQPDSLPHERYICTRFSVELFIAAVYAAEAKCSVSACVLRKVPYSPLASGFFRCVQALWELVGMDWGTRQLVLTSVIDRWAQESGLWPYWHLSPALTWFVMSNETASCPPLLLFCMHLRACVLVFALMVAHTCRCIWIQYMLGHSVSRKAHLCRHLDALPPQGKRSDLFSVLLHVFLHNLNTRTQQLTIQIISQPTEKPVKLRHQCRRPYGVPNHWTSVCSDHLGPCMKSDSCLSFHVAPKTQLSYITRRVLMLSLYDMHECMHVFVWITMPEDLCVYEAHVPSSVCLVLWAGEVVLYVLAEIVTPGLYFVCVYGGK